MESSPSAQSAASFFYYTPDPQSRPKQHGHFLPHPTHAALASHQAQLIAPTPVSAAPFPSQLVFGPANSRSLAPSLTITPSASPSLLKGRSPSEITMPDTPRLSIDSAASEMLFTPATPTLSFSSTNTPQMSQTLLTPIGEHGWSLEESGCGTISPMEIQLPGTVIDWRASSPEAIYAQPVIVPSNASPAPSTAALSHPTPKSVSMSPSTSQSTSAEVNYCDPRNLTFQESDFGMEFPTMPTLCGADDEHRMLLGNELMSLKSEEKGFKTYGLDFMEELSDLDSEDDFINGLTSMSDLSSNMMGEQQDTKLEVFDESEGCLSDDDSDQLLSPPMSTTTSRQGSETPAGDLTDSRPKKRLQKKKGEDTGDDEDMTEGDRLRTFKFGSSEPCESRSSHSGRAASSNVIRRGRKQSLTEDPTKTFVCHLCGRRFRRQEHLKRHFRSLHTEDKPFSCGECGKKFSRSDNLTQHARIHGSGAILLGVLDENEMIDRQYGLADQDTQPLGIVVVDALQAASGSTPKDVKISDEKRNRRNKRKRSDE